MQQRPTIHAAVRLLLLVGLLLALCTPSAAASDRGSKRSRRHRVASLSDEGSVFDPPEGTTPFGPFTFSGELNSSVQTDAFMHFTLPAAAGSLTPNSPQRTPSLAGPGATLTLTSDAMDSCNFVLCATRLVRPFDDTAEWALGSRTGMGRSDVCEAFLNATSGSTSPASVTAQLTPGLTHFAVYTRLVRSSSACAFTLTISGDACPEGLMGTPTGCESVNSTSAASEFLSATLPAEPPSSALYFEVHPTSIYASSMRVHVNSGGDNVTVFVHEGSLPSLTGAGINSLTDFNLTSQYAVGDEPAPYHAQAVVTLDQPSYRIRTPNQRYFLGVTRTGSQLEDPTDTDLTVQVAREQVCNKGYHGPHCEFFVRYILDPFELVGTPLNTLATSSFSWNYDKTEIWLYFGLLFLNVDAAQNFSVGIQSIEGQLVPALYLRQGQIPTLTQFDARGSTVNPGQSVRFLSTGPTELHDAVWYLGINVPISYPSMGDVALWINTPCPGSSSTLAADGSVVTTECNGHGTCMRDIHQCKCSGRWYGWNCMAVDESMGMSPGTRALIILGVLAGVALFGYALCWWFREGAWRVRRPMANAGYGHQLDAPGEGGGAGGPRPPAPQNRPPNMGRI